MVSRHNPGTTERAPAISEGIISALGQNATNLPASHRAQSGTENEAASFPERQLSDRFKSFAISHFEADLEFRFISAQCANFDEAEILGRRMDEVLPVGSAEIMLDLMKKAMQQNRLQEDLMPLEAGAVKKWFLVRIAPRTNIKGEIVGTEGVSIDVTDRKAWEDHLYALMRESLHRNRNIMSVLLSITRLTGDSARSVQEFRESFTRRLQSIIGSYEMLTAEPNLEVSLPRLVEDTISAFESGSSSRFVVNGPEIFLKSRAVQNLGLAIYELATNASKYGALSVPGGRVDLNWSVTGDEDSKTLQIVWKESGGPAVKAPTRKGFGSTLLQDLIGFELNGKSFMRYDPTGVQWTGEVGATHFRS